MADRKETILHRRVPPNQRWKTYYLGFCAFRRWRSRGRCPSSAPIQANQIPRYLVNQNRPA